MDSQAMWQVLVVAKIFMPLSFLMKFTKLELSGHKNQLKVQDNGEDKTTEIKLNKVRNQNKEGLSKSKCRKMGSVEQSVINQVKIKWMRTNKMSLLTNRYIQTFLKRK